MPESKQKNSPRSVLAVSGRDLQFFVPMADATPPEVQPRFRGGLTLITPAARTALNPTDVTTALGRHISGDWGDCGPEDWKENELSLKEGFRLFSVYHTASGVRFWVVTEADRSATTVLLPEEY